SAGACRERERRRAAGRRLGPRRDDRAGRRGVPGRCGAALRAGALDDLCRRSVRAMEDARRFFRSEPRVPLAAGSAMADVGADRWMYVGGSDREFLDPRLNEGFLRRVARTSGGRYVRAADASRVASWLQSVVPQNAAPEHRDLWHEPWAFALVISLLCAEWI